MNRELQNQLQDKIANTINQLKDLIVFVSMRVGKTRAALKSLNEGEKVLVVYPNKSIKDSWTQELKVFTPKSTNITYCTKASIHKLKNTEWDTIILDELPMMVSDKQLDAIKSIKFKKRIALTGSMNNKTERKLREVLNIKVGFKYSVRNAIEDGLIKDYKVFVHFVKLRNNLPVQIERFGRTITMVESNAYDYYTNEMNKASENKESAIENLNSNELYKWEGIYNKNMVLRTNFLYNSQTLYEETLKLINQYKNQKVLIYTMRTDIADALSDDVFHSKNNAESVLETFKTSTSGHLAVVNSVSAGITIQNLNTVIFHSYDSNTETIYQKLARALLYDYNEEFASIHIMCLENTQMELWMEKACEGLEQDKIFYIKNEQIIPKLEYYKQQYPDKELYLYKGSIVYYSHDEQNGIWTNKMYKFIGYDRAYGLPQKDLIKI